ncbi:hypothetical protein CP97_14770 [Aurantiacibacter atlanticus]|uniref:Uncharacterized protein n=1 Tax=Aurantiacibacter atlanticus TaxID=1648404 RepID=A0A168M262_9SPHN|nr:hypothetical protein [Aurantiacibacter atlanticus]ANC50456.1 hypothetical protein CP97_14770 [Aurantiacibacter atlanticus]MDF1835042.1 hypothetical protein [Alteraurantiacibacter sp. bin_em_oilr2.035]
MGGIGEGQIVSIIALVGWLVLALGAYQSHQMDLSKTLRIALTWSAIFAGITFGFSLIM